MSPVPYILLTLCCLSPTIAQSLTVIDILSQNPEFGLFLRLLQKYEFVPVLNELTNVTLIAPVNSAFAADGGMLARDDVWQYLVNDSFLSSDLDGIHVKESMAEPQPGVHTPILVENQDIDQYTRSRIFTVNGIEVVEPDLIAYSQDGVVHGINKLLDPLPSTCDFISKKTSNFSGTADIFSEFLAVDHCTVDSQLSRVSVLLPLDSEIYLNDVEIRYLVSEYGKIDRNTLIDRNLFDGYVGGSVNSYFSDYDGNVVHFENIDNGKVIVVDGKEASYSNILTNNGIIHIVQDFSTDTVVFTPRKYLYGLDAADFVDQIDLKKLGALIDDVDANQTLFIYEDEEDNDAVSVSSSSQLKNILLYHFVDGKIKEDSSQLYDSKMCSNKKIGANCQKIKIKYNEQSGSLTVNNEASIKSKAGSVGNTDIFFLSNEYNIPMSLRHAVNSLSRCTTSMKYLEAFNLLDLKNNKKGYTVFLPCFSSWSKLDLTLEYLKSNSSAMRAILQNGIVHDLVYSDFKGPQLLTTNLNGDLVEINKEDSSDDFTKLSINSRDVYVERNSDIIFDQGVVQPIEGVVIPPSVKITLSDLIKTASPNNNVFLDLLEFTNLSYVLDNANYSVILPSAQAMKIANFTRFTPLPVLETFLKLHILPNNASVDEDESHDTIFDCGSHIPTLLESVHLECRPFNEKSEFLKIVEGGNIEVRVVKTGCSTEGSTSCVFVLDNAILPDWLSTGKKLQFHIPIAVFGFGFLIGILFIFLLFPCCLCFMVRAKKVEEPDIEENNSPDPEQRALLSGEDHPPNYRSTSYPAPEGRNLVVESAPKPILKQAKSSDVNGF